LIFLGEVFDCGFNHPLPQVVLTSFPKYKNPALNNAGLQESSEVFGFAVSNYPSCLAVCFTWPQVALTHHVLQVALYARRRRAVKVERGACLRTLRL